MTAKRVLIAEDDSDIASILARGLSQEGYEPEVAEDEARALSIMRDRPCGGAVIDMMLGDDRGDELVRKLRREGLRGPVLMLSALTGVEDRTVGLDAGADDYIAKPFDLEELLTRYRTHEARRSREEAQRLALGQLAYDAETRTVSGPGRREMLTERESDLLTYLLRNAGQVVTRGDIYDSLWKKDSGGSENVVDVYLGYLRRKLAPLDDFGVTLRTIRARGFVLAEAGDA